MNSIAGKRLLVFTAHPDDEAFVAGGTIHLNMVNGGSTFIVCATHGERGRSNLGDELNDYDIKTLRHRELNESARKFGIQKMCIGSFPDRELINKKRELADSWVRMIESFGPDLILGFGRNGYTGHLDHAIAGEVAHKLAGDFNIPYLAFSLPGGDRHFAFESCFQKKRAHGKYIEDCSHKDPDITIEIDPEIKYDAIKIYKSQLPGLDPYIIFSKEDAEHFLRYEYFSEY